MTSPKPRMTPISPNSITRRHFRGGCVSIPQRSAPEKTTHLRSAQASQIRPAVPVRSGKRSGIPNGHKMNPQKMKLMTRAMLIMQIPFTLVGESEASINTMTHVSREQATRIVI